MNMITIFTDIPSAADDGGFADTSFWIALTNEADGIYQKAQSFSSSLQFRSGSTKIVTSESVLTEFLNYFAGWGPHFRDEASTNVQACFQIDWSRLSRIRRLSSRPGWTSTDSVSTRGIVSPIAFRCRSCAVKA
jgi:hypothetical protein